MSLWSRLKMSCWKGSGWHLRGPAQHRPSIPQEDQLSVTLWVRRTQAEVEIGQVTKLSDPACVLNGLEALV